MARVWRLDEDGLNWSEQHAKRLIPSAKARVVRTATPVTWTPPGTSAGPLDYADLYAAHVQGAFIPRCKGRALHLMVKLPDSVPVATVDDAEAALQVVIDFGRSLFGEEAVFAGRMDRDEKSFTNAELFIAPRYVKKTRHTEKVAVSLTRDLKQLAEKYGELPQNNDILRRQGQVLQDEFARFLCERGYTALRGRPKRTKASDWIAPEGFGARADRAIAETERRLAADERAKAARERKLAEQAQAQATQDRGQAARDRAAIEGSLAEQQAALELEMTKTANAREEASRAARQAQHDFEQARRIQAEAEEAADQIRREAKADAEKIKEIASQAAERDAQTVRERAQADADAAQAAIAKKEAETTRLEQALDQRQRAIGEMEQRTREALGAARAAADRAEADAEKAEEQRRKTQAINEEARRQRDATEQTHRDVKVAAAQIALVGRAIGDEGLKLHLSSVSPLGAIMDEKAMTHDELSAYRSPWANLSRMVVRAITSALQKLADLKHTAEQLMKQAREEKAAVERDRAKLRDAEQKLTQERDSLNDNRRQLEEHQRLAADFIAAYEAVSEAKRTPPVAKALKKGALFAQAADASAGSSVGRIIASKGPPSLDESQMQPTSRKGAER